jgi:hypothetical protein
MSATFVAVATAATGVGATMKRLFKTQAEFQAFAQDEAPGKALHVLVLHDNECTMSRCVCSPWFEVRELTAETAIDGARRQRQWLKDTAS